MVLNILTYLLISVLNVATAAGSSTLQVLPSIAKATQIAVGTNVLITPLYNYTDTYTQPIATVDVMNIVEIDDEETHTEDHYYTNTTCNYTNTAFADTHAVLIAHQKNKIFPFPTAIGLPHYRLIGAGLQIFLI